MVASEQARSLGLGNIICQCITNCEAELRKDLYGASPAFCWFFSMHTVVSSVWRRRQRGSHRR
jgi:hypothetical protein